MKPNSPGKFNKEKLRMDAYERDARAPKAKFIRFGRNNNMKFIRFGRSFNDWVRLTFRISKAKTKK